MINNNIITKHEMIVFIYGFFGNEPVVHVGHVLHYIELYLDVTKYVGDTLEKWILKNESLEYQPDECIEYVYNLIKQ